MSYRDVDGNECDGNGRALGEPPEREVLLVSISEMNRRIAEAVAVERAAIMAERAALTADNAALREQYRWRRAETELPKDREMVLVHGGVAQFRSGAFFTGMETPHFQRPIQWRVDYWQRFTNPTDEAQSPSYGADLLKRHAEELANRNQQIADLDAELEAHATDRVNQRAEVAALRQRACGSGRGHSR